MPKHIRHGPGAAIRAVHALCSDVDAWQARILMTACAILRHRRAEIYAMANA
jgi:hypothetical protein